MLLDSLSSVWWWMISCGTRNGSFIIVDSAALHTNCMKHHPRKQQLQRAGTVSMYSQLVWQGRGAAGNGTFTSYADPRRDATRAAGRPVEQELLLRKLISWTAHWKVSRGLASYRAKNTSQGIHFWWPQLLFISWSLFQSAVTPLPAPQSCPESLEQGAMPIARSWWVLSLPIDLTGIQECSGRYREGPPVRTSCLRGASRTKHQIQGKDKNVSDRLSPEKPQRCLNDPKN